MRRFRRAGYRHLLVRDRAKLDLTRQTEVEEFFSSQRPEYVFVAAAKVGGIQANTTYPADFLYINMMIEANIIHSAFLSGVRKLLFLGSSCIYPKHALQPIREEYLMTGALEPTNEAYAVAKLSGIALCKFYRRQFGCHFISALPTNLYGIHDNFDLDASHVLPALLRKFHEARIAGKPEVTIWGTGTPRREFLFVDDLADALLFLMQHYDDELPINVGTGEDMEIRELAELIGMITGYKGAIRNDLSKPDGTPLKRLDVTRLHDLGWHHTTSLEEGIRIVYDWYCRQGAEPRVRGQR